jgi:MYXO-CTERM domain-containing protein
VKSRLAFVVAILACATPASAAPILSGTETNLTALADGYQRTQDVFAAAENGLSLDPVVRADQIDTVRAFFGQPKDFVAFTGKAPFDVLETYDEHGDEGNFAGVASVGVAARLMVLRAAGADVTSARAAAIRAARAWHVYGAIGGDGVVARGVRKLGGPGPVPTLVPLKDASGALPRPKAEAWRAPVAAGFDGWIWLDDTSKDQVVGYALATAWLWDALHDDPLVPPEVTSDLAADLVRFAHALMKVAPELGIDMCLRDADGRLTSFHDLNARQLTPDGVAPEDSLILNGFNAALGLAIVRAAYHVSGDEEIGRFYYEELIGKRGYDREMLKTSGLMFVGPSTNYSNVNMLAIALAILGRFETDPGVLESYESTLQTQFWSHADDRDVSHVHQAWYDAVFTAYSQTHPSDLPDRIAADLGGFPGAPAFERDIQNCDAAEIAALSCVAIDGKTIIALSKQKGHGGSIVAQDVVPRSVRPDSDFFWRSDPHEVNGASSNKLDPGGDYLAAYWLSRASDRRDTFRNRSPFGRKALPYTRANPDEPDLDAGADGGPSAATPGDEPKSSGCGCTTAQRDDSSALLALLVLVAAVRSRAPGAARRSRARDDR